MSHRNLAPTEVPTKPLIHEIEEVLLDMSISELVDLQKSLEKKGFIFILSQADGPAIPTAFKVAGS